MSISETMRTDVAAPAAPAAPASTPEWRTALPWLSSSRAARDEFSLDDLQNHGWSRYLQWIFDEPHWLFWLLRTFWPIPRLFNWAFITRYDDVSEVLRRDDVFHVPFESKVRKLNADKNGPNFLLGMQRGDEYWHCQRQVMEAFRYDDVDTIVAPLSARLARDIVAAAPLTERGTKTLDAVEGLITRVPIRVSRDYYGVEIPEAIEAEFGHWTIAMSLYTFGNPLDNPRYERAALAAGKCVRQVVNDSIARAKCGSPTADTVLARLVQMQKKKPALSDVIIASFLIGMITGFVPTNTMAAGHMLGMLLRRPKFMAAAKAAAQAGDDDRLMRCLFEAMRFWPLNPGPFRICARDYTIADGMPHAKTIKRGTKLLAGTESAMFDNRRVARPRTFDPDRPPTDYMLFGHGLHWCIGAYIAQAQITQTFKALLLQKDLTAASGRPGKLKTLGPFPWHLHVEFRA